MVFYLIVSRLFSVSAIPAPDGLLHIYSLPVGQGDARVIQCPSGTLTVVDTGTNDGVAQGFWHITELKAYFQGSYNLIRNIILSHDHQDHYRRALITIPQAKNGTVEGILFSKSARSHSNNI